MDSSQIGKNFTAAARKSSAEKYPLAVGFQVAELAGRFEAIIELGARDVPEFAAWLAKYWPDYTAG